MSVITCKLPKGDGTSHKNFIRVQTEWSEYSFRITLLDQDSVWMGKASSADLISTSNNLSLKIEDYMKETRAALTTHGGVNEFVYAIEQNKFTWKKMIESTNPDMKVKFGSVPIEMVPATEMINHMMDTIIDVNCFLHIKVTNLEKEKTHLMSETQVLKTKLAHYKDAKKTMEEALYHKFIEILNAKKKRILMLEEEKHCPNLVESGPFTNESVKPLTNKRNTTKGKSAKKPGRAVCKKKYAINEDSEEEESSFILPKKCLFNSAKIAPSTSKLENLGSEKYAKKMTSCHSSLDDQNHYDSETDRDSSTEDETTLAKDPSITMSDYMCDNIDTNSATEILPQILDFEQNEICDKALSTLALPTARTDSPFSREAARESNTQQLLDELGI